MATRGSGLGAVGGWTGRRAIRTFTYPLDLVVFIGYALGAWLRRGHFRNRATRRATVGHILLTGINPLPATLIVATAAGFTIALPFLPLATVIGEAELASLLLRVLGMELAPVLTAVVVIGRAGSAMATELANMRLHGETDALEDLGVDLRDFFVAPRLLAASLAQVVLATYFTTAALFIGMPLASLLVTGEATGLALAALNATEAFHFLVFVGKNALFGLLLSAAACYSAIRVDAAAIDVPMRVQQAITSSLVLVFLLNGVLAALWP